MGQPTVLFDARPLQPETRHWGPGVFVENILERLSPQFRFRGLAHRFPVIDGLDLVTWPRIPKTHLAFFEISPALGGSFDVYWGTNHVLPALLQKPSAVTVHDLLILNNLDYEPRRRILAARFHSSLRRASRVVSVSRTTADALLQVFPDIRGKLEVILNGFDVPKEGAPGKSSGACRQELPYLVMLGAHRPRKNLTLALGAVERAREIGIPVRLRVTGNVHPCFRGLIADSEDTAELTGVLSKGEVMELVQNALALLFPSLYEGFGFPILEAMAVRCPVVALDTPINREIAGIAARLLPPDVECWASAIRDLVENPSLREDLIGKGLENLRRFSWDAAASAYAHVFEGVSR